MVRFPVGDMMDFLRRVCFYVTVLQRKFNYKFKILLVRVIPLGSE